ncbi:50S ribosomal protein L23 [Rickettsiales bacterium LUAb2]
MASKEQNNKQNTGYAYEVIRHPLVTEKSMKLSENNKVLLKVASFATKLDIKKAMEQLFKAKVVKVNVINQAGKNKVFKGIKGTRSSFKKAVVTLEAGSNVDLGTGV